MSPFLRPEIKTKSVLVTFSVWCLHAVPRTCMGSLQVLGLLPAIQRHASEVNWKF